MFSARNISLLWRVCLNFLPVCQWRKHLFGFAELQAPLCQYSMRQLRPIIQCRAEGAANVSQSNYIQAFGQWIPGPDWGREYRGQGCQRGAATLHSRI